MARQQSAQQDAPWDAPYDLHRAHSDVAGALDRRGDTTGAIEQLQHSIEAIRPVLPDTEASEFPNVGQVSACELTSATSLRLASFLEVRGADDEESRGVYGQALRYARYLAKRYPSWVQHQKRLVLVTSAVGQFEERRGEFKVAASIYAECAEELAERQQESPAIQRELALLREELTKSITYCNLAHEVVHDGRPLPPDRAEFVAPLTVARVRSLVRTGKISEAEREVTQLETLPQIAGDRDLSIARCFAILASNVRPVDGPPDATKVAKAPVPAVNKALEHLKIAVDQGKGGWNDLSADPDFHDIVIHAQSLRPAQEQASP